MKNALLKQLLSALRGFFFGVDAESYYICGADSLPLPLSEEEERAAVARLLPDGAASEDARRLLVEHNLRLVVYIAKKFETTGIFIEDLISIGTIGLIKAVNTFRPDKNIKLATYASRCIENEILMFLRKTSGQKCEMSFDEPLSVDKDGGELLLSDILGGEEDVVFRNLDREEDKRTVHQALSHLGEREQTIIALRFGMRGGREHTQKEVAEIMGISQSYISRLEKKIIAELREEIARSHLTVSFPLRRRIFPDPPHQRLLRHDSPSADPQHRQRRRSLALPRREGVRRAAGDPQHLCRLRQGQRQRQFIKRPIFHGYDLPFFILLPL